MHLVINHTCHKVIRNLGDDLYLTLRSNPDFRFSMIANDTICIEGRYDLLNPDGKRIDWFFIRILVGNQYPHSFPRLYELGKIERNDDNHIGEDGKVCTDFTYVELGLQREGIRIFDFVNYYMKKYFSWYLVKISDPSFKLSEWSHGKLGVVQFYELLFKTKNKTLIRSYLSQYLTLRLSRQRGCFCNEVSSQTNCHIDEMRALNPIPPICILKDINLFS